MDVLQSAAAVAIFPAFSLYTVFAPAGHYWK